MFVGECYACSADLFKNKIVRSERRIGDNWVQFWLTPGNRRREKRSGQLGQGGGQKFRTCYLKLPTTVETSKHCEVGLELSGLERTGDEGNEDEEAQFGEEAVITAQQAVWRISWCGKWRINRTTEVTKLDVCWEIISFIYRIHVLGHFYEFCYQLLRFISSLSASPQIVSLPVSINCSILLVQIMFCSFEWSNWEWEHDKNGL